MLKSLSDAKLSGLPTVIGALPRRPELPRQIQFELARHDRFVRLCQAILRIREEMRHDNRGAQSRALRYKKAEEAFKIVSAAWIERVQGKSIEALYRKFGTRINGWFYESGMPREMAHLDPYARAGKVDLSSAIKGTSPLLAHFLGVLAGKSRPGFAGGHMQLRFSDPTLLAASRRKLASLHNLIGVCRDQPQAASALQVDYAIAAYFVAATESNTHLPWLNLTTSEERSEFIRGFIKFSGISVKDGKPVIIQRKRGAALLKEFTVLLLKEGIISSFVPSAEGGVLLISDQISRSRLDELLDGIPANRRTPKNNLRNLYLRAREMRPGCRSNKEIIAHLAAEFKVEVKIGTLARWLSGAKPVVVQNEEAAISLARVLHVSWNLKAIGARWTDDLRVNNTITASQLYHRIFDLFGDIQELLLTLPQSSSLVPGQRKHQSEFTSKELADLLLNFGIALTPKDLKIDAASNGHRLEKSG